MTMRLGVILAVLFVPVVAAGHAVKESSPQALEALRLEIGGLARTIEEMRTASLHPDPAWSAKAIELDGSINKLSVKIDALKAAEDSTAKWLIPALFSLAGVLAAAVLAAAATYYSTVKTVQQARLGEWDDFTRKSRMEVFPTLFTKLSTCPRERGKLDASVVAQARQALIDWYHVDGGGLVMTADARDTLFAARDVLGWINNAWPTGRQEAEDAYYAAAFLCMSRVRSALISDVQARRQLGAEQQADDSSARTLRAFRAKVDALKKVGGTEKEAAIVAWAEEQRRADKDTR